MAEWKRIEDQAGIDALMGRVAGFHDSCVVSARFTTGKYVDEKGAMYLSFKPETYVLLLEIHSQWSKKSLEMLFTGVYKVNLAGYSEKGDGIIFDAHLAYHEDVPGAEGKKLIVWADWADFVPGETDIDDSTTYIYAESLSWREKEAQ